MRLPPLSLSDVNSLTLLCVSARLRAVLRLGHVQTHRVLLLVVMSLNVSRAHSLVVNFTSSTTCTQKMTQIKSQKFIFN